MSSQAKSEKALMAEIESLKEQLAEARETLDAIRRNEIDALVMENPNGTDQIFTINGADLPYRLFVEKMSQGAVTLNLSGSILYCNQRFAELMELPIEQIIGSYLYRFVAVEDKPLLEDALVKGDKANFRYEMNLSTSIGKQTPFDLAFSPMQIDALKVICLVATDLTEKKRVEEALQKTSRLESLGVLAGGIAHDFNNLLTGIIGYLGLTNLNLAHKESIDIAEIAEFTREAEKAALRSKDLTMQLLTFAKGGNPIRKTVKLIQLIREAASFVMHGRNVETVFNLPEEIGPVEVDAGQLSQVIQNLTLNAAQAMPGGGYVSISAENLNLAEGAIPILAKGKYVKISIKDTGLGISSENIAKIFDPYFTTKTEGHGLGLAVCYSIIKKHDGYITVESEPTKGSTFSIYLPLSDNERAMQETMFMANPVSMPSAHQYQVLIMEDEPQIRDMFNLTLPRMGHKAKLAKDGAEALQHYEAALKAGQPFDVVFLDLTIPGGMGGMEAMSKLLELDPQVKAIVCSGYSNDPVMSNYREHGFWDVLVKPFRMEELARTMRRLSISS
ncbi:ATP-binding protein [Candidatus Chlorohelix sp.]|uniref:hybrid sensor histidine kinase/response regulator n=1 Tax=Candidatus Chlorohelix sp. TaxID=3139201 RepID=UPI00305B8975